METYNLTEASKLLGLSRERVRQFVWQGRLPATRDKANPQRWSITRDAIETFRANRPPVDRTRPLT